MATYYVSGAGVDTNNGTSPNTPWRNAPGMPQASGNSAITLQPGDIVYMMDGTWTTYGSGAGWDINNSGTESSPIRILAYSGCDPILDNRGSLASAVWTSVGGGIWSTPITATTLVAMWIDGSAIKASGNSTPTAGEAGLVSNVLYVNSGSSPPGPNTYIVTNGGSAQPGYCMRLRDRSYIHVDGIATKGGNFSAIILQMAGASSVIRGNRISRCDIGWQTTGISLAGIVTNPTGGIFESVIEYCTIHSNIGAGANYTTAESSGDGIRLVDSVENALIKGCVISDFAHSGIDVNASNSPTATFMRGITIISNDISAPQRSYGRAIGVAGLGAAGVMVVGNRLHDHPTRNQYGCIGGVFSGNVIERVTGTVVYGGDRGEGLMLQTWDTGTNQSNVSGCVISNNTIASTKNAGIALLTSNAVNMGANTIANNVVSGAGGADFDMRATSGSIATQTVINNCFAGNAIYDRSSQVTVSAANAGAEYESNISSAPLLDASYRLGTDSPCYGAGTYIAGARDFSGRKLKRTPDIGAKQYYAERGVPATLRSARSTATIRDVVASLRTQRLVERQGL